MYAGRIVETRAATEVFRAPSHPYTRGLVGSLPLLGARAKHGRQTLKEITGVVPPVAAFPMGCRFNPRCDVATEVCRQDDPGSTTLPDGGLVRCHHHA
jgi:peptide/nickel transport system ATP-binding protein